MSIEDNQDGNLIQIQLSLMLLINSKEYNNTDEASSDIEKNQPF